MSLFQDAHHFFQAVALGDEEHQIVVHQVGGLVEEAFGVVVLGFDDQFDGFFPYLLRYPVDALAGKPWRKLPEVSPLVQCRFLLRL